MAALVPPRGVEPQQPDSRSGAWKTAKTGVCDSTQGIYDYLTLPGAVLACQARIEPSHAGCGVEPFQRDFSEGVPQHGLDDPVGEFFVTFVDHQVTLVGLPRLPGEDLVPPVREPMGPAALLDVTLVLLPTVIRVHEGPPLRN